MPSRRAVRRATSNGFSLAEMLRYYLIRLGSRWDRRRGKHRNRKAKFVPADHSPVDLDDPLASVGLRVLTRPASGAHTTGGGRGLETVPLVMRALERAPDRTMPEHRYDPVRQIAVNRAGDPLLPDLKKDWTTIDGTHTDGDGGDNESWTWEEV